MKKGTQHTFLTRRSALQLLTKHVDILSLFEFSNVVNASSDVQFILDTLLRTLMGKFVVSRGMVLLRRSDGHYTVVCVKGISESLLGTSLSITHPPTQAISLPRNPRGSSSWRQFLVQQRQKMVVPLWIHEKCIGILTLGDRHGKKKTFTTVEQQLLLSLANLSTSALEKAQMIAELDTVNKTLGRRVQELNTLFDLSKEFNIGLNAQRVLRLLTLALLGQMGVQQYAITFSVKGAPQLVECKGIAEESLLELLTSLYILDSPVSITELMKGKRTHVPATELLRRGMVAIIPMRLQNTTQGLICLGKGVRGNTYTKEELEFLFSVASLAAIAIENAYLLEEALEKQRIEDEIHIAREIQQGLLPAQFPAVPVFDCAAINIPSKDVGGDYYDVIPLNENEYLFAIGDVAGKGIPASLLMANVQAALRALAPYCTSTSATMARVNDVVCSSIRGGNKFITFFTALLNTKTLELLYTNAGHNSPLVVRSDGTLTRLEKGGLILGVFPNTSYEEQTIALEAGDVVVFYTDGISEAMNAHEEEFTEEHLEELVKESRHLSAEGILTTIQTAVEHHIQKSPQSDDITLLVLKIR